MPTPETPPPALIAFFTEIRRLAQLARERQAAHDQRHTTTEGPAAGERCGA